MNFTLTISDSQKDRFITALAYANGYLDNITTVDPKDNSRVISIPNPVSKSQYVKDWLICNLKSIVAAYESKQAVDLAKQNSINDVATNLTIS